MSKQVMYEALVEELRELRLRRDKADATLLLRLLEVERNHMGVIEKFGIRSFAQFLKSNGIVDPARYENFKAGLSKLGGDAAVAMNIGSEAVIAASQLTTARKAAKFIDFVETWRDDEEHGGTFPSQETAERLLRKADPREEEPEVVRRKSEVVRLRAENSRLKAENTKLRARVEALEKQLGKHHPQPRN